MKNRKTANYYYELWTQKHGKTEYMNTLNIYNNNIFKNSLIIKLLEHWDNAKKILVEKQDERILACRNVRRSGIKTYSHKDTTSKETKPTSR